VHARVSRAHRRKNRTSKAGVKHTVGPVAARGRYHRAVLKLKSKSKSSKLAQESRFKRAFRAVPWMTLAQVTVIVGRRWSALSAKERARATELMKRSGGRINNLSVRERMELRKLAHKLDLRGMGRELLALRRVRARRSRRRRGR
jgi:hypothetical protein